MSTLLWRPLTSDDLAEASRLATQCDAAHGTLETPLVERFLAHSAKLDASHAAFDGGRMVAFGWVRTVNAPHGARACSYTFAEPGHPILVELVEWLDQRGTSAVHEARFERVVAATTVDLPQDVVTLYERLGYAHFYTELELARDVGDSERTDDAGSLLIVPWSQERHAEIRGVYNDAFRERGSEGYSDEEWPRIFVVDDDFQASVSFVELDGGKVIGFIFARVDVGMHGWIDSIGVLPSHWRRGVAARLIERVADAIREVGGESVGLRVNEDNDRAIRVYQRLGFVTACKHVVYRRVIG